jgi:hypothetical protein
MSSYVRTLRWTETQKFWLRTAPVNPWARSTVHTGVSVSWIDARPLAMWICPQKIRLNGIRYAVHP